MEQPQWPHWMSRRRRAGGGVAWGAWSPGRRARPEPAATLARDDWGMRASEDATLPLEVAGVVALAEQAVGGGGGNERAALAKGEAGLARHPSDHLERVVARRVRLEELGY